MSKEQAEKDLIKHVSKCIAECQSFHYTPSEFMRMIGKDGTVGAIKKLIHKSKVSEGFIRLWDEERLDLSMEAVIFENRQYDCLFSEDEREIAKKRLKQYEYKFKS